MGHLPEHKYSEWHQKYMNDELSLEEFLEWYRNPAHYRPELPSTSTDSTGDGSVCRVD